MKYSTIIIDYGMGNLGSIKNILKYIGIESHISNDIQTIKEADKLILSGVGAFDNGIKNLENQGLMPILDDVVIKQKKPILGICLGMQLFTKSSEEGNKPGLGWIDATTIRFKFENSLSHLKIPHMGWNIVYPKRKKIPLFENLEELRFYFVHSYHLICDTEEYILGETHYGYNFASVVQKENIVGTQFHPEKSHKYGMQLLKNFCSLRI